MINKDWILLEVRGSFEGLPEMPQTALGDHIHKKTNEHSNATFLWKCPQVICPSGDNVINVYGRKFIAY
jgi:hypothetical protein